MELINVEQLVAFRTARGWDQKQLADAAGIDRSVISRLERGIQADCRVSVLVAIAAALGTPIELLISSASQLSSRELPAELTAAITRLQQQPLTVQLWAAKIIDSFLSGLDT